MVRGASQRRRAPAEVSRFRPRNQLIYEQAAKPGQSGAYRPRNINWTIANWKREKETVTLSKNGKVRVAIVGVGNCASSLVQGVHYYRDAQEDQFIPGLMHVNLGGY